MRIGILSVVILIFISGCFGPAAEKLVICPSKGTLEDSVRALNNQAKQVKPFRAGGRCFVTVYENQKRHKENFSVRLWFNPPNELRLFGEVAFNARGLDIGCNESEFWFGARPKELGNSFSWGKWSEQQNAYPGLGQRLLLEAFGRIDFDKMQAWSLSNEGPFDILIEQSEGRIVKKIYIYCCDYRIRKIEYFDAGGKAALAVELGQYQKSFNGSIFAMELKVRIHREDGKEDLFRIVFGSVKEFEYTGQRRKAIFGRPTELGGFENIYRIVDGQMIEVKK